MLARNVSGRPSLPTPREIELSVGRNRSITRVIVLLLVTQLTGPWGVLSSSEGVATAPESKARVCKTLDSAFARFALSKGHGPECLAFFCENRQEIGEDGDHSLPSLILIGIFLPPAQFFRPLSSPGFSFEIPEARLHPTSLSRRLRC